MSAPGHFFPSVEEEMGQKERDASIEKLDEGFEVLRRLVGQLTEPLPLPPQRGHARFRRTAARLRAGEVQSPDPEVPAEELAASLEESVQQAEILKAIQRQLLTMGRDLAATVAGEIAELRELNLAAFHELKRLAKDADPDSPIAQEARRLQRAWRKETGRRRPRR
jgi:hypothetical protein